MGRGTTATVDLVGAVEIQRRLNRAAASMQSELVQEVTKSAAPMLRDMRSSAFTKIQRHAVGSVLMRTHSNGVELTGGNGSSLGATLFVGGEFGGRVRKRTYQTHSPRGTAYFVTRRTTRMFLPHLGTEGYFFFPAVREWLPKVHDATAARAFEVLDGQ